ncbi:hypothetical protein JCM25156A_31530 [Komagataeibacter kakiaceti JCM 25156]
MTALTLQGEPLEQKLPDRPGLIGKTDGIMLIPNSYVVRSVIQNLTGPKTPKSLFGKSWMSISAHEIGTHGDEDHGL